MADQCTSLKQSYKVIIIRYTKIKIWRKHEELLTEVEKNTTHYRNWGDQLLKYLPQKNQQIS